jgi:hypothetical protein
MREQITGAPIRRSAMMGRSAVLGAVSPLSGSAQPADVGAFLSPDSRIGRNASCRVEAHFDCRAKLECHGARITSGSGLPDDRGSSTS